jgi:hypothetical protein
MSVWPFFIGMAEGAACVAWGIWLERRRWSRRMTRHLDAMLDRARSPDEAHWSPDDQQ